MTNKRINHTGREPELKTYDDVRDLSIQITDTVVDILHLDDGSHHDDWYPWDLQDAITELIQEYTGIKEEK